MAKPFVATPAHGPMELWEQAEKEANGNIALHTAIYYIYMRQAGHVIDVEEKK